MTTREDRAKHVAQMNASSRIEGFEPDAESLVLQERYINGQASLEDMLDHAREFAAKASQNHS